MLLRLTLASLALLFPVATLAVPVSFDVMSGPDLGTGFWSSGGCGGEHCGMTGTLYADFDGNVMSNLHGSISFDGFGSVGVTGGLFDFGGGNSWMMTDVLGGFGINDVAWNDSGFWFGGTSWDSYCTGLRCKRLSLRLWSPFQGKDCGPAIPEPSAAVLFGLGAIAVTRRRVPRR